MGDPWGGGGPGGEALEGLQTKEGGEGERRGREKQKSDADGILCGHWSGCK